MSAPRYDVVGIGNAIVDVLARAEEDFLVRQKMPKGTMALIGEQRARQVYDAMGPAIEISGGSAANSIVGVAGFGRERLSSARSGRRDLAVCLATTSAPPMDIRDQAALPTALRPGAATSS